MVILPGRTAVSLPARTNRDTYAQEAGCSCDPVTCDGARGHPDPSCRYPARHRRINRYSLGTRGEENPVGASVPRSSQKFSIRYCQTTECECRIRYCSCPSSAKSPRITQATFRRFRDATKSAWLASFRGAKKASSFTGDGLPTNTYRAGKYGARKISSSGRSMRLRVAAVFTNWLVDRDSQRVSPETFSRV